MSWYFSQPTGHQNNAHFHATIENLGTGSLAARLPWHVWADALEAAALFGVGAPVRLAAGRAAVGDGAAGVTGLSGVWLEAVVAELCGS